MRAGIVSHLFAISLVGLFWNVCKGQSDLARPAVKQAAEAAGYSNVSTSARGWPFPCGRHASRVDVTAVDVNDAAVAGYACVRQAGPELRLKPAA